MVSCRFTILPILLERESQGSYPDPGLLSPELRRRPNRKPGGKNNAGACRLCNVHLRVGASSYWVKSTSWSVYQYGGPLVMGHGIWEWIKQLQCGKPNAIHHPQNNHKRLALVARLGLDWSPVTPRHFAWQARHLVTSIFVSRGRRGTWRQPPSFHVAGVALRALGWLWWRAWARIGRRWRWL